MKATGIIAARPWRPGLAGRDDLRRGRAVAGGTDFYKEALIDLDPAALGSRHDEEAFDRMAKLRTYVDDNFSGRDWNLASAMVIKGKAGMQIMGDWAKGEFLKAGKKPGKDFLCFRFPGTQGNVTFNSDQFVMFKVGEPTRTAQLQMAIATSRARPSSRRSTWSRARCRRAPTCPTTAFDACGKKGMADLAEANKNGTLFGSMAQAMPHRRRSRTRSTTS